MPEPQSHIKEIIVKANIKKVSSYVFSYKLSFFGGEK
jgi:hypothetical protein